MPLSVGQESDPVRLSGQESDAVRLSGQKSDTIIARRRGSNQTRRLNAALDEHKLLESALVRHDRNYPTRSSPQGP